MKLEHRRDIRGIWALAWRSVVLLPVMLATFFLLVLLFVAVALPPVFAGIFLFAGLWWLGVASIAAWVCVLWAWRRFRLVRLFESSPSFL